MKSSKELLSVAEVLEQLNLPNIAAAVRRIAGDVEAMEHRLPKPRKAPVRKYVKNASGVVHEVRGGRTYCGRRIAGRMVPVDQHQCDAAIVAGAFCGRCSVLRGHRSP